MPTSFDLCEASRLQSIVIKDWALNLVVQLPKAFTGCVWPYKVNSFRFLPVVI